MDVDDLFASSGGLASLLSPTDWTAMCSLGSRCLMAADYPLFRQGDEGEHVYVILSGAVKVVRGEAVGKSAILTIRGAGDVVGDLAVMDGGRRSGTVATLTPMVVRVVPGGSFKRFIERPSVTAAYARYTVNRLRQSDVQRTEIAVLPVRQRLARALLRLYVTADAAGGQRAFELPQQDLAELIGASRNAVVLALGVLRAEGVLDTHRMRVSILDVDALHRRAG